jgi:ABC-type multidrug transport system ATPase subunit
MISVRDLRKHYQVHKRPPGLMAALRSVVHRTYTTVKAVDGISFEIKPGERVGFLGPNGAGKTTTMKTIYGLATVDGGRLQVLGLDANRDRREIKSRIGVVPQETNLDGDLTVRENLLQQARYFGIDGVQAAERADELLAFSLLTDRAGERIHALSGGMKRRLLISTSRPPGSTPRRGSLSGTRSTGSGAGASPCSSPPTTWRRPSASATGW